MAFSIFPKTIYKTQSKISGEIIVRDWLGERSLIVQGVIQSGGVVRAFWKTALKKLKAEKDQLKSCLVLGLGGGSVFRLVAGWPSFWGFFLPQKSKGFWPQAKIVSLEIDVEIIKAARRFFGLDNFKNLKIINSDAFGWLGSHRQKFDLILVDLYLGRKFPKEAEKNRFFENLKKNLAKNGIIVFNRLKKDQTEDFEKKLEKHFSKIEIIKTPANLLFVARSGPSFRV